MRRRAIIVTVSVLLVTAIGCVMLLFPRESNPPRVINGDFSPADILQIQRAVRHQLWHETFPNFSVQTFKTLPVHLRAALTNHVACIGTFGGTNVAFALWGTNFGLWGTNRDTDHGYYLTNGPSGWRCQYPYFYVVPD